MALQLINLTGYQSGIEFSETAINLESFSVTYKPEFKRKLPNYLGQTIGFVVPTVPSAEVTISGEVSAPTNLMAATFVALQTLTNDTNLFGRSSGAFFLDEATEDQSRDGWRRISLKLSADPLVTAA